MSERIHRSHNVSVLLYHIVCPAKYRRAVVSADVDKVLRDVCLEIAARHEITFLEIGTDRDHVHFLVQTIPPYSPTKVVRVIKNLTAREVFRRVPAVKQYLWAASSGRTGTTSARSAITGAKVRSSDTSPPRGGSRSTPSCIPNNSDYSEGIRPVPLDTPRLAAGRLHQKRSRISSSLLPSLPGRLHSAG